MKAYFVIGAVFLAGLTMAQAQTPRAPEGPIPATTPMGGGPDKAIMEMDPSLPGHTLYHPAAWPNSGTVLPIVVWGNGACANQGNRFRWFLSEIASYGYFVVAVGPIGPDSAAGNFPTQYAPVPPIGPNNPVAPPPTAPSESRTGQLIDAINWATAENNRPGSRYFHKLDARHLAVMGQSCGGVQAIEASADPRVFTSVIWDSGLFPGTTTMAGGKALTKADLAAFHGPVAYISGDAEDIAFDNANDDFDRLRVPAFRAYERGVIHTATYRERNGGEFGGVAVAWLNWQLKGDAKSGRMFQGSDCGLCVNPRWVVRKKNMN